MLEPSPSDVKRIAQFVRAGASWARAAVAANIPEELYREWMIAADAKESPSCVALYQALLEAENEASVTAEISQRKQSPQSWLRDRGSALRSRNRPLAPTILDSEVEERQAALARIAGLRELRWQPALRALSHLSLIEERAYANLRGRDLDGVDGELCRSVDTIRKLIETQFDLFEKLGLTPNSEAQPDAADKALPAVYRRIEQIRETRKQHERKEKRKAAKIQSP
jgi:hypothetical protein